MLTAGFCRAQSRNLGRIDCQPIDEHAERSVKARDRRLANCGRHRRLRPRRRRDAAAVPVFIRDQKFTCGFTMAPMVGRSASRGVSQLVSHHQHAATGVSTKLYRRRQPQVRRAMRRRAAAEIRTPGEGLPAPSDGGHTQASGRRGIAVPPAEHPLPCSACIAPSVEMQNEIPELRSRGGGRLYRSMDSCSNYPC
jgi:hypothetical protein